VVTVTQRRQAVTHLLAAFPESSQRRACRLVALSRSRWQYRAVGRDDAALRQRLRELAAAKPRWGYEQLHILLRREGHVINHKKVLRLYREEDLAVAHRRHPKRVAVARGPLPRPTRRTERWSMDFVSDALSEGRGFRCFTLVDDFTRECPAIGVAHAFSAQQVIAVLDRVAGDRGVPLSIVCDNGPEFTSHALDRWATARGVRLQFIRPGKPVENAFCESFNGKLRLECLNANWFTTLAEAQQTIEAWRREYNEERPHTNLGRRTPAEFTRSLMTSSPSPMSRLPV
jgi:putative transposase